VSPLAAPSRPWVDLDGEQLATPASTLKLWTAVSVLDAVPSWQRLSTHAFWDSASGSVILVGGGDTTLETDPSRGSDAPSLSDLAEKTARKLIEVNGVRISVRVRYDATYFVGPEISPQWEPTYVSSGVIAPVTALMVDQGRIDPDSDARLADPAGGAALRFAELLEDAGLTVKGRVTSTDTVEMFDNADPIAKVQSAPVSDLVEQMLRDSDNQLAESLGRVAASAAGEPASFAGAVEAIRGAALQRGVDLGGADLYDVSGLSREDTLPTESLISALQAAGAEPSLAPVLSGLAVAGFDGTLADRFVLGDAAEAAGLVRAKTGTLTGISAEAGVATTCDGALVAYAFVADEVDDTLAARAALDEAAAALASCPGRG
jgi:D-alanyl-D-alanine carboxypeptidase/D-alanyl-D-alanine-endopeptidase (penicillin-binding protein 4)